MASPPAVGTCPTTELWRATAGTRPTVRQPLTVQLTRTTDEDYGELEGQGGELGVDAILIHVAISKQLLSRRFLFRPLKMRGQVLKAIGEIDTRRDYGTPKITQCVKPLGHRLDREPTRVKAAPHFAPFQGHRDGCAAVRRRRIGSGQSLPPAILEPVEVDPLLPLLRSPKKTCDVWKLLMDEMNDELGELLRLVVRVPSPERDREGRRCASRAFPKSYTSRRRRLPPACGVRPKRTR